MTVKSHLFIIPHTHKVRVLWGVLLQGIYIPHEQKTDSALPKPEFYDNNIVSVLRFGSNGDFDAPSERKLLPECVYEPASILFL